MASLTAQREEALASLRQVDATLAALSSAIAFVASLNEPDSLHCTLTPVANLAPSPEGQGATILMKLSLHNCSSLTLSGSWSIVVSLLSAGDEGGSIGHAVPLPSIPRGSSWTHTFRFHAPSLASGPASVAVFLCFTGATAGLPPPMALLHSTRVDCLHSVQACSDHSGSWASHSSSSGAAQRAGVRLGVPKSAFGLAPEPHDVLETLLPLGSCSMAPSITFPEALPASEAFAAARNKVGTSPSSSTAGHIHGHIHSGKGSSIDAVCAARTAPLQAGPSAAASRHVLVDLQCETASLPATLHLHEAVLHRVQLLREAVQHLDAASHGLKFPGGVVVLSPPRPPSNVNAASLETMVGKLGLLDTEAKKLRGVLGDVFPGGASMLSDSDDDALPTVLPDGSNSSFDEREARAQLQSLVCRLRDLTSTLPVTL